MTELKVARIVRNSTRCQYSRQFMKAVLFVTKRSHGSSVMPVQPVQAESVCSPAHKHVERRCMLRGLRDSLRPYQQPPERKLFLHAHRSGSGSASPCELLRHMDHL